MKTEDIYREISTRMLEGMMLHDQLYQTYLYIGLSGYARRHLKHYKEEADAYARLAEYYITQRNGTLLYITPTDPQAIPKTIYKRNRRDLTSQMKREIVRDCMNSWIEWERGTKELMERMYRELIILGEVSFAQELAEHICDVDAEIREAESEIEFLKSEDYDLISIIIDQPKK